MNDTYRPVSTKTGRPPFRAKQLLIPGIILVLVGVGFAIWALLRSGPSAQKQALNACNEYLLASPVAGNGDATYRRVHFQKAVSDATAAMRADARWTALRADVVDLNIISAKRGYAAISRPTTSEGTTGFALDQECKAAGLRG